MSWDGAIPCRPFRVKGLRNKRKKYSKKAVLAREAKMAKLKPKRTSYEDQDYELHD